MKNALSLAAALALTGLVFHTHAQTAKPMAKETKMEAKSEEKMETPKEEKMENTKAGKMRKHAGTIHHSKMASKGKM